MPAIAARALSLRSSPSGTLRIWIIFDMCTTWLHVQHMSFAKHDDSTARRKQQRNVATGLMEGFGFGFGTKLRLDPDAQVI